MRTALNYTAVMSNFFHALALLVAWGTAAPPATQPSASQPLTAQTREPFIVVLGTAQDGGLPHVGCIKPCCAAAWNDPRLHRPVACLALVDPATQRRWLFDATPDFPAQLQALDQLAAPPPAASRPGLDSIFLTHAHIGHYTGLMYLGREALGARNTPVYCLPRLSRFLATNGPWSQLVELHNIELRPLVPDQPVELATVPATSPGEQHEHLTVTPLLVPHRDEFSETAGFVIAGPHKQALFIPDIDKWEKWSRRLEDVLAGVDVAFLDGTFFDASELPGRNMLEIPHPFMVETMERLASQPPAERAKVYFIHLNHSNPAQSPDSAARQAIESRGFHVVGLGERFEL